MAKKLFVLAKTEAGLNNAIASGNLNAEVAFIEEEGKEGIYAKSKIYQTIPSDGKEGQVLTMSNGRGVWKDNDVLDLLSYGVEWYPNVSDPHLTRVGNMTYHKTLPILSLMKGCIYRPKEKKVVYWLDENDWKYRKDPVYILVNSGSILDRGEVEVLNPSASHSLIKDIGEGLPIKIGIYTGTIQSITKDTNLYITSFSILFDNSGDITWSDIIGDSVSLEILSRLDGYDGEVMVYVPSFYIRSWDEEDKKCVRISSTKIDDTWEYLPALFIGAYRDTIIRSTPPVNMGYLSTLEVSAVVSIANNSSYCRGGDNNDLYDTALDTFKRNLGKCVTSLKRGVLRENARKAGKEIISYRLYKNIMYWLYIIEYANFRVMEPYNSELTIDGFHQGGLGNGITNVTNWGGFNNLNPICPNGYTNSIGNNTGIKLISSNNLSPAGQVYATRWRGIENLFGDIMHTLDGILVYPGSEDNITHEEFNVYITDDPSKYGDTIDSMYNMDFFGRITSQSGYIEEFNLKNTSEIIPLTSGGSNTTYKCDYLTTGSNNDNNLRAVFTGGYSSGKFHGLCLFYCGLSINSVSLTINTNSSRTVCVLYKNLTSYAKT